MSPPTRRPAFAFEILSSFFVIFVSSWLIFVCSPPTEPRSEC